jgi:hypothetical protein
MLLVFGCSLLAIDFEHSSLKANSQQPIAKGSNNQQKNLLSCYQDFILAKNQAQMKKSLSKKFKTFMIIASCLAALCLLDAYFIEPNAVVISRIDLPTAKFPVDFTGLNIVQLSDIHLNRVGRYERKVIQYTKPRSHRHHR